jgi:hypothetical protein
VGEVMIVAVKQAQIHITVIGMIAVDVRDLQHALCR